MSKKDIKKRLEQHFINEVAKINKILDNEEEKVIMFNYLKTYTLFLGKKFCVEVEI